MRYSTRYSGPFALAALAVAAALLLAPVAAAAQTVVGTVVDRETTRPVAGAFVVLESDAGRRTGGALAGTDGRFILRAPAPGTYTLRAQFIGYADAVTESFELAEGQTVERTIAVAVRAVSLDGIRAEVGARCRPRPGSGPETARLWEEARKALEVAAWTEDHAALRFNIIEHKRELEATSFRVTAIREAGRRAWYDESPYRALDPDSLADFGYVQPAPGESDADGAAGNTFWDHFAPDAAVLLSESFLDTHCFRVASPDDAAQSDLVGLAFEPVPGRERADIRGVLWVDRGTAELRTLEYTYVNLPYADAEWEAVGGRVEFERLATGMWIVRQWRVRMPLEATLAGGYGGYGSQKPELELRSLVEEGARVTTVRAPDGRILAQATGATLYGAVTDAGTGEPLGGATVTVVPTGLRTTTAPDGVYRLGGLPEGVFTARVTHPDIELLGGVPLEEEITLEAGRATRLAVAPSLGRLALERCADAGRFEDPVVVFGRVEDPAAGVDVPGALVRMFTPLGQSRVVTDSLGGYALCIERVGMVELAATGPTGALLPAERLERVTLTLDDGPVARQDLTLPASELATMAERRAAHRGTRWSNALIGTVIRHGDGAPIPGAMVVVRDLDGRPVHSSVTNEAGQFRFVHPDSRTRQWEVSVEHVAYGTVSQEIAFSPAEQLDIEVVLTERAIEVDPIVVTARRQGFLVEMGVYDRIERGAGAYVLREDIQRRRPNNLAQAVQGTPGIRLVNTGQGGKQDVRIISRVSFATRPDQCQPSLWLDGNKVRTGGRVDPSRQQMQLSDVASPEDVEAIEVYDSPAGLPPQYTGSDASCGVVLVWTRRAAPGTR